jgi:hypothetical protein
MVKGMTHEGRTIYVCDFCGLGYDDILLAYSCNEYCRTHNVPWSEISKRAIYNSRKIARHPDVEPRNDIAELRREIVQLREEVAVALARVGTEVARSEAQDKVTKVGTKLAEFVPRDMVERLTVKTDELERKLAFSVPRSEADALEERASRLEAALGETLERLNLTEERYRNLESRLREFEGETFATRRIKELETTPERGMSSCPNCRQPTYPDDLYCGRCGSRL